MKPEAWGQAPTEGHAAFMREALDEAEAAWARGDLPIGAVLVHQGQVLARGGNTREAEHDPTGHAELVVLRQAAKRLGRWRLHGCALYVSLEPCPMCAAAIAMARLDLVVFAASDPKMGACGSRWHLLADTHLGPGVPVLAGVMEAEAQAQLRSAFGQLRRPPEA